MLSRFSWILVLLQLFRTQSSYTNSLPNPYADDFEEINMSSDVNTGHESPQNPTLKNNQFGHASLRRSFAKTMNKFNCLKRKGSDNFALIKKNDDSSGAVNHDEDALESSESATDVWPARIFGRLKEWKRKVFKKKSS
ncbi:hypothetical protein ENBRE01_0539 [Enteropsectra breve]|nr:hypothetical protein ENBRE01_0539 [Enteropsectra breve]